MAVNLAVTSGLRTVLFDLDPQESAVMWADRRQSDSPHVEFLTERRLLDGLKAAEQGSYDLNIAGAKTCSTTPIFTVWSPQEDWRPTGRAGSTAAASSSCRSKY
jgi:hypothetical protein